MQKWSKQIINAVVAVIVVLLVMGMFSVRKAQHACKSLVENTETHYSYHGTRLVLFPDYWLSSQPPFGMKLGWIISFTAYPSWRALGFFVSLTGEVLGSGRPRTVVAVEKQERMLRDFAVAMTKLDAAMKPGTPYSNAVAFLGKPISTATNEGIITADFCCEPPGPHGFITNGFTIAVSNNVVVGKWPRTTK